MIAAVVFTEGLVLRSLPGRLPELAVTHYLSGPFDYRLAFGRGQSGPQKEGIAGRR
jgi:hypothetical protein